MISLRRSALATFAFVLFSACGSETITEVKKEEPPPPPPPPPVVASVSVAGPTRLVVGRVDTVKATARAASSAVITGRTVSWSSSNTAAVTVGSDGAVRAVAPGTAVVSATVDNVVGSISITASDASIVSLTLTPPANVLVGGTAQIGATARDSVNQPVVIRSIAWTTSSPNVATVSPTGVVTGVSAGTATISAAVFGAVASATITVIPVPVASIFVPPYDSLLRFRFPKQIVALAKDSAGNTLQRAFTYTTSSVDVATLDPNGLATAQGQGFVAITASAGGKSANLRYFVPSDSGLYVAVVGGVAGDAATASMDQVGATSPTTFSAVIPADTVTRFNFVTSNGTYRVRGATIGATSGTTPRVPVGLAGIALLLGIGGPAPTTLGPPSTVVSFPLKPYTATITAPATAPVNTAVTVTWTFDEATQPFSFFPDRAPTGTLYFSTTNGPDLSGTPVAATVTRDASGMSQFSATFTTPATAGTLYLQVAADGAVARLLYPISFRGIALRTITVQ